MAAQLGHQPAAGAVPEPPADQLLDRRPVVDHLARGVLDLLALVAELLGLDDLVGQLGLDLGQRDAPQVDGRAAGRVQLLLVLLAVSSTSALASGSSGLASGGIGCCQLSWPGRLPRCHWARM